MNVQELRAEATELMESGNSKEKAFGAGMMKVIEQIDQLQVHELWNDDLEGTQFVFKYEDVYGK